MKKLRVSSTLNLYASTQQGITQNIREGLEFHKEMGFDAANLDFLLSDFSNDGWQPYIERAIADSEEVGVKFELCHLPYIGSSASRDADYLSRFNQAMLRAIDAAKLLGSDYAVLHPNALTLPWKKYDRSAQYDLVMKHLSPFAEYAAKVGVNIVVENMRVVHSFTISHRYCQTPEELCEVADALGIGVCWDFGHANISGIKQSEGLAYIGKRLKVIHVNDNAAVDDEHIAPFTGNIDWRDAMHGLALADFDGLFNYEIITEKLPASVRRSFARYLIDAAGELMSYIE